MFGHHLGQMSHKKCDPVTLTTAATWASIGTSAVTALSALTSKGPSSSAAALPETPAAPTVMPVKDTALTMDAKRRSLQAQVARGGRSSTILSDSSDSQTFGG